MSHFCSRNVTLPMRVYSTVIFISGAASKLVEHYVSVKKLLFYPSYPLEMVLEAVYSWGGDSICIEQVPPIDNSFREENLSDVSATVLFPQFKEWLLVLLFSERSNYSWLESLLNPSTSWTVQSDQTGSVVLLATTGEVHPDWQNSL